MQATRESTSGKPELPQAPKPPGLPILGNLFQLQTRDRLAGFLDLQRRYGDIVRLEIGPRALFLINGPEMVQYILQDNNRNYVKGRALEKTKKLLGNGLLTWEGENWRRQRRLIQPAFHRQHIASFANDMIACTEDLLGEWEDRPAGEPFNVAADFLALTLEIVGRTLFGAAITSEQTRTVATTMPFILRETNRRIDSLFDLREKLPTPTNRRMEASVAALDAIVYGMIEGRRRSGEQRADLLGMLIAAQDEEDGSRMSDRQVRDEVMTLFLAGHETTANNLAWTFWLLAEHPEVRHKLQAELDRVLGGRTPTAKDTSALVYTRMVIDESLRMCPPAWAIGRQPIEDDVVGGYRVPGGSGIIISPYVMHRHLRYWKDPERFFPDRFAPAISAERPKYAYIPFGGGPRQCIGNNFALMEATLVLAMLAQRYDFELASGHPVEAETSFTLRPKHGIWIRIQPR